jgi:hypothetical protein
MKKRASKEIVKTITGKEFRVCPHCEYQLGFHVSFIRRPKSGYDIILICPDCGTRYTNGWKKR